MKPLKYHYRPTSGLGLEQGQKGQRKKHYLPKIINQNSQVYWNSGGKGKQDSEDQIQKNRNSQSPPKQYGEAKLDP